MSNSMEEERKFELREPVTPYVCSTPDDFNEERDWLAEHVFPKLAELCVPRGTYFSPVDVRWSVDDSLVQEGHLLHVMLDLIKHSSPYFLCLLGECYGPYKDGSSRGQSSLEGQADGEEEDWLDLNLRLAAECGHQWVTQGGHENCSVPELEVMAATLRGDSHQCTFYFRQAEHLEDKIQRASSLDHAELYARFLAESEHAGLKIQSLKQTIVKRGLPVRYFKTPQELGQIVLEDWTAVLDTVCPPLPDNGRFLDTSHYQLWISREALLTRLRSEFVESPVMDSLVEELNQFVLSVVDEPLRPDKHEFAHSGNLDRDGLASNAFRPKRPHPPAYQTMMVVNGDRGAGKSAGLAYWLQQFAEENPGIYLIHHFIGAGPGDNDIAAFLRRCTRDLRKHFLLTEVTGPAELDDSSSWWSEEDQETPRDFNILCQAFVAALGLGPCILLLDGINNLSATMGMSQTQVKEFQWLPEFLPRHCRIILSTSRSDLTYRSLCRRGDVKLLTLPGVKDQAQKMSHLELIVKPHVLPLVKKKWNHLSQMRVLTSPLALCVLGTELNEHSVYTQLHAFVEKHYETTALHTFFTNTLQEWVLQHSWINDEESSKASKDDGLFDYTGWVADALSLLTVSRGGLLQDEVLQLLENMGYTGAVAVNVLQWLHFRLRAGQMLWEAADGRIRLAHQHLQDITEYTLLRAVSSSGDMVTVNQAPHQSARRKIHMLLASHFAQQPLSWRQAQELPWHYMMAGNLDGLEAYLTNNSVVQLYVARRKHYPDAHHDLRFYWDILEKEGHKVGPCYVNLLSEVGLHSIPSSSMEKNQNVVESWLADQPEIHVMEQDDHEENAANTGTDRTATVTNKNTISVGPAIGRLHSPAPSESVPGQRSNHPHDPTAVKRKTIFAKRRPSPRPEDTGKTDGTQQPQSDGANGAPEEEREKRRPASSYQLYPQYGRPPSGSGVSGAADSRTTSRSKRAAVTTAGQRSPPPAAAARHGPGSRARPGGISFHHTPHHYGRHRPAASAPLPASSSLRTSSAGKGQAGPGGGPAADDEEARNNRILMGLIHKKHPYAYTRRGPASSGRAASASAAAAAAARTTSVKFTEEATSPGQRQFTRPLSSGAKLRGGAVLSREEVDARAAKILRPSSAPYLGDRLTSSSSTSFCHKRSPKKTPPIRSPAYHHIFLTQIASDPGFSQLRDVLDGVEDDDLRKVLVTELGWGVGCFLQEMEQTQHARAVFSALLAYVHTAYPLTLPTQLLLVRLLERLGTLSEAGKDTDDAASMYHQALRMAFDMDMMEEDMCDHRQVDTFKGLLLNHHGYLRLVEGDVLEAGELLKEATETISHLTGNHVLRAALLYHLGLYRGQLGEVTRSETSLRQCLALRQQWHGKVHPEVGTALLALARLIRCSAYNVKSNDERKEAASLYRQALSVTERCLGNTHLQIAEILAELGELMTEEDNNNAKMEAKRLLQRSLDIRTTELGADHSSTKAARASVRRVELSLQPGHGDLSARAEHTPMPQRDMRLPFMAGASRTGAGQAGRGGAGGGARPDLAPRLDIRSVSREKVLLHNRPDSMLSSVFSHITASERLLASRPVSSSTKGGGGAKGSRGASAVSSAFGARGAGTGSNYLGAGSTVTVTKPVEVRLDLDEEEMEGRSEGGGLVDEERGGAGKAGAPLGGAGGGDKPRTVVVDLGVDQDDEVEELEEEKARQLCVAGEEHADIPDTPHLDSFAVHLDDGTIIIGEEPSRSKSRKRVKVRPQSTPHHLFHHYASIAASEGGVSSVAGSRDSQSPARSRPRSQRSWGQGQTPGPRMWSARTAASSAGSHVSRCAVPGPHDIRPGKEANSLAGPHAHISSLLGPPVCPRDNVYPEVHHRSAFYHVPGRYATHINGYAPRRSQKTEGARILSTVMAAKLSQLSRHHSVYSSSPSPTLSTAPRPIGVNQHDITMLVRQTGVNRPESRGGALLASARDEPLEDGVAKSCGGASAVKFRETITVS